MLVSNHDQVSEGGGPSPKAIQPGTAPAKLIPMQGAPVKPPHPKPVDRLVTEHPFIIKDTDLKNPYLKHIVDHVTNFALNPDKGSGFDKATRWYRWLLKHLPKSVLIGAFKTLGYDGMVFTKEEDVVGHQFWQRHRSELRVFSIYVAPEYRGQGLAEVFIEKIFEHGAKLPGIERVRIGGGKDLQINHILKKISARASELGVVAEENCFFRIKRS